MKDPLIENYESWRNYHETEALAIDVLSSGPRVHHGGMSESDAEKVLL